MAAILYKVGDKYRKAAKILTDWHFVYEETPRGNLLAEPMDFSVNDKMIRELGKAGYFCLPCQNGLSIRPINSDDLILINQ